MTSTQNPAAEDPAATNDEAANDQTDEAAAPPEEGEVEPYIESEDHVPNPHYQSGVVDTSGVSGGLPDVRQATPVFAQHRAATLRAAATEYADGDTTHVTTSDGADREEVQGVLDTAATHAEEDPRVSADTEAIAEEITARDKEAQASGNAPAPGVSDADTAEAAENANADEQNSAVADKPTTTSTDAAGNQQQNADADQTSKQSAASGTTDTA